MSIFVDFHTHHPPAESSIFGIQNCQTATGWHDVSQGKFSVGLHPWYLQEETIEKDLEFIQQLASHPNVLSIGECGLDRNIPLNMKTQLFIFERQIMIAEKLQKPVVIHCVRAFPELITLKKKLNPSIPLIVHGFNNNPQLCKQLVSHNFYLSLGAALGNPTSNASKVISSIPIKQLFLETDDKNCTISSIFALASKHLNTSIEVLQEQIVKNLKTIVSDDSSVV